MDVEHLRGERNDKFEADFNLTIVSKPKPLTSQPVITVSNLTKFYGDFKALDAVSFSVDKGGVYGYLGPNGAGKTTTMGASVGHVDLKTFFLAGAKCALKRIKNLKQCC